MGLLLKPRISEREAAGIFLGRLLRDLRAAWPRIFDSIRPSFPEGVALVDNDQAAVAELFLSVIAGHLENLEEVFDAGPADRLRAHIREVLSAPPFRRIDDTQAREYHEKTLEEYHRACEEARGTGKPLAEAIAGLLHERLGASYRRRGTPRPREPEGAKRLLPILEEFGVSWWRYLGNKYRIAEPRRPGRWGFSRGG